MPLIFQKNRQSLNADSEEDQNWTVTKTTLPLAHYGSGVTWDFICKSTSTNKKKIVYMYMLFVQKLADRMINGDMWYAIYKIATAGH